MGVKKRREKFIYVIFGKVFIIVFMSLTLAALSGCLSEADSADLMAWNAARRADTLEAYGEYLSGIPDPHFAEKAMIAAGAILESNCDDIETLKSYVECMPNADDAAELLDKIIDLEWDAAKTGGAKQIEEFLAAYPQSVYADEAKAMIEGDIRYNALVLPDEEAKGVPLFTLLADNRVTAVVTGNRINSTSYTLTNNTGRKLTVLIPLGTWFSSGSNSVQNMIVTKPAEIILSAGGTFDSQATTACMNMARDIPGSGDSFTVNQYGGDNNLTKLMELLNKNDCEYATVQAAVWIITDGASDSALLSVLVDRDGNSIMKQANIDEARAIVGQL